MNTKTMLATVVAGMGMMAISATAQQYGGPQYGGQRYDAPQQYNVQQYGPPPSHFNGPGYGGPAQNDFQQRGYMDGVQGAQRDAQNHRVWDVNNRDEYRKPHVPGYVRGDYRDGFRRGYYDTVRRFEHGRGGFPR